jgi:hypothetical protein
MPAALPDAQGVVSVVRADVGGALECIAGACAEGGRAEGGRAAGALAGVNWAEATEVAAGGRSD